MQDEKHRLVAAALSGFSSGSRGNTSATLCQSLSKELESPYLRTLFAVIANGGNWISVLETTGLPLRDQINAALHFLSDTEVCVVTLNPDFLSLLAS